MPHVRREDLPEAIGLPSLHLRRQTSVKAAEEHCPAAGEAWRVYPPYCLTVAQKVAEVDLEVLEK